MSFHSAPLPQSGLSVAVPVNRIGNALLWLTAASGALVFIEPSPYELISLVMMLFFVAAGFVLSARLLPLIFLLLLCNLGYGLAVVQLAHDMKAITWVLVSLYLAVTAVFFAAVTTTDTQARVTMICRGYVAGAAATSVVGILAYFHVFGGASEIFLKFGRARGTFNDPNVFGAFLIFPSLIALQRVLLAPRMKDVVKGALLLTLFVLAILVSFSRAAWGQFIGLALLVMVLTLLATPSPRLRLRVIMVGIMGMGALALLVAAILSVDSVADLFAQRASLNQDYDTAHFGRFGRYTMGAQLALDRPFGIGPYQFNKIFPEDPHNTFLNAFITGGWLTGFMYPAIVFTTIFAGFRFVFVRTPWQHIYIVTYAAFVGVVCESAIIDIDHWRHFFLLLGLTWGMMIASTRKGASEARAMNDRAGPALSAPAHASANA